MNTGSPAELQYWNQRNADRRELKSSEYNKKRHVYLHSLINQKRGVALKVDLWNEGGNKGCFDIRLFKDFDVIGLDTSKVACIKAKRENPQIHLMNATLNFLPLDKESVDVIFDISTSDHIPLDNFCACIRDYARILARKGELLLIFNNRLPGTERKTCEPYSYWFTVEEVKQALSPYFEIKLLRPYGTHPNELKHWLLKAVKRMGARA